MARTPVAVIGCGFFAQNHLNSWKDLSTKGAEIVAVCDIDPAKAQAAAQRFGVPHWYSDAETMFRERKPDLVDIVTQVATHQDLVTRAIGHGIATIVQKPFGLDIAACRAMAETTRKAGGFLAVHENFRFQTPMRRIIELLKQGAIGEPNWARISFRTGYDIYKGQPYLMKEERFALMDLGVHVMDLARVFMGEVAHLSAELQRRNPKVRGEDTVTTLLRHRNGGVSIVECTYEARRIPDAFPEVLLEIEGPVGSIVVKPGEKMVVTTQGLSFEEHVGSPLLSWTTRPWHVSQEAVRNTNAHMLDALRAGHPADTSGEDNLKTYALVEAAYESASKHVGVRPKVSD